MTTRVRAIAGAIALTAIIGFAGPASAQSAFDVDSCDGNGGASRDQVINGCTALIQSDKTSKKMLINALFKRGMAYRNSDFDRAIEDFSQLIKLVTDDSSYFYYRGVVYFDKGEYDRAIQDFDQALKLDPTDTTVINARAQAIAKKNK